jgi:hypothetical protein
MYLVKDLINHLSAILSSIFNLNEQIITIVIENINSQKVKNRLIL